ncbi:hypothetical protein E2562_035832 [Oryza meyeriana var. granulata]|uniref:Uncharacterized protein n=1 Tax=Oryza meyeriana var. granulata TaxID=110450 RepID=A0A6G1DAV0_9ORYZ|nr:hypothetical protein E2562_035832 [Oryza meyeriana var. granulata]
MGRVVLFDVEANMMEQGQTTTTMTRPPQNVSATPAVPIVAAGRTKRPEGLDCAGRTLLMIILIGGSLGVFVTCLVWAFERDQTVSERMMSVFLVLTGAAFEVTGYHIIRYAC